VDPGVPLLTAFPAGPGRVLALAGGGGKTTLMYALARAQVALGRRVITTTTTRINPPERAQSPALLLLGGAPDRVRAVGAALAARAHVTVAVRQRPDGKLEGIPAALVDALAAAGLADGLIVEADGSAGRPLKAARDGEPVFPPSSTACVLVVGIEALGAPLAEPWVFRAALAAEVTGLRPGAPVTAEAVRALLLGPRGLARSAPVESEVSILVNKVETSEARRRAYALARFLLGSPERRLARVVVGSASHPEAGFAVLER
jgi:probable selenium-dependent hydroxylase accessory protein YqeC